MLITGSDVERFVDMTGIAIFTENFGPCREIPGGHHGHDGAEHRVGGEQSVLGVEAEAVVGLVSQAHSELGHGPELLGDVHTQIVPD